MAQIAPVRMDGLASKVGRRIIPSPLRSPLREAYKGVQRWSNKGTNVQCPCCGETFRKFLPYGRVLRENARCQTCGALERHRMIWLYIEEQTDLLRAPLKVMHSAPEGPFLRHLREAGNLDYTTVDIDAGRADLQVDLTDIQVADDSFDVVICNHVLEHIIDDRKAMAEMRRVLRPGGWSIITVPQDRGREATFEDGSVVEPDDRLRVFGQEDHVRIYGRDFPQRLRDAGFLVDEVHYGEQLPAAKIRRYGLKGDEVIYRCSKAA